jgi:ribosome maturation factor RimP
MYSAVQDIIRQVTALVSPLVEEEGIELWGVDFRSENGRWVLRLTLDREGGISLDDLTQAHRQLSDLLDAHDPVPWRYTLEVSSPGINRPLLRPSHYQRYLGQRVRMQTRQPHNGRRMFVGTLREVEKTQVCLIDSEVGEVHITWDVILKASAEHNFPVPAGKKKGAHR